MDVETVAVTPVAPAVRTRPGSSRTAALSALLGSLPVLVVAVLGWAHRWMSDDGFINIRVVDNVFAGHGPVFNIGERVEVGTSTAWLGVLVLGHAVTPSVPVSRLAVWLGLACTLLAMVAASAGSAALWRRAGRRGLLLPLGTVALAALPPFWDFATSGLETGLTFLWLGLSFLLLARRLVASGDAPLPPAWRPLAPAAVIGLGPLVRPDLTLVAVVLGVALLAQSRRSLRSWVGAAAAALAVPVCYEVLRAGYYGSLVPNTALAKGAGSSLWSHGLVYLDDFAGRYALALPLVVVLLAGWAPAVAAALRRGRADLPLAALLVAPVLGGLLHGAFVVRVGGDFMHGRFLLPATFAVLLPMSVVPARRLAGLPWLGPVAVGAVLAWAVVVGTAVRVPYEGHLGPRGIADERGFYLAAAEGRHPLLARAYPNRAADLAAAKAREGAKLFLSADLERPAAAGYGVVARTSSIGIFALRAGPDVLVDDSLALANAVGSRLVLPSSGTFRAGHSQQVPPAWDRARYAAPDAADPPEVLAARQALACGELRTLHEATTAPMTAGRFVANLRAAVPLTRLTIPADPAAARDRFCGR